MGFRIRKRINLGGGFGLNVSNSGISPSLRTKYGTVSNKRMSVRTGIKGVTYTKNFNKAKGSGCMVVVAMMILITTVCLQIL